MKIATTPVYDLAQLAERDDLTRIVLENLDEANKSMSALPGEIADMLGVLPHEVREEVEAEWNGENRHGVLNDVRAIILEALASKGGNAA